MLALSWRLSDPRTTQTPLPKTPLTPGMGFLSDTTDSSPSSPILSPTTDDEESQLLPRKSFPTFDNATHTRQHHPSYHTLHSNTSTPSPTRFRTLTTRNNDFLSGRRRSRAFTATEANDIWSDILDNTSTPVHHHRQSSARSTPSKLDRPVFRPRPMSAAPTESGVLPRTTRVEQDGADTEDQPLKSGKRASSFGRTYRNSSLSAARRSSIPLVGNDGEYERPRQRIRGSNAQPRQQQQQGALGGWWKMRWWKDGKGKGKIGVSEREVNG